MGKKKIKKSQAILQLQGSSPALFTITMVKAKPKAVRRKEGAESWQCPDHSLITSHQYKRFSRDLTLLWKLHELNSFPCVVQHLQLWTEIRARSCFQVTTSLLCSRFKRFCFVGGGGFFCLFGFVYVTGWVSSSISVSCCLWGAFLLIVSSFSNALVFVWAYFIFIPYKPLCFPIKVGGSKREGREERNRRKGNCNWDILCEKNLYSIGERGEFLHESSELLSLCVELETSKSSWESKLERSAEVCHLSTGHLSQHVVFILLLGSFEL